MKGDPSDVGGRNFAGASAPLVLKCGCLITLTVLRRKSPQQEVTRVRVCCKHLPSPEIHYAVALM